MIATKELCAWKRTPEKKCGVIVGCDSAQEWLLEWWWERYRAENAYPVTFVDMGMSEVKQTWCSERGEIIKLDLDASFVKSRKDIDLELAVQWDAIPNDVWGSRKSCFKKPFALLLSPYECSVWLDLDCEILGSIHFLFSCLGSYELALVREYASSHFPTNQSAAIRYNGGTIVYAHGAEIVQKWALGALTRNHSFSGDDGLLSALIYELKFSVLELPEIYNWIFLYGLNINVIIQHWCTPLGKEFIKKHCGIKPGLKNFLSNEIYDVYMEKSS